MLLCDKYEKGKLAAFATRVKTGNTVLQYKEN